MIEGQITITDEEGSQILSVNIWEAILTHMCSWEWTVDPERIHVFIDGDEIHKPEMFEDDT